MSKWELPIEEKFEVVAGDYQRAGEASASIKRVLRDLKLSSAMMRRVAVASYEAELNLVIHSLGGSLEVNIDEQQVILISKDRGPGIPSVVKAMESGFSTATDEARDMGFGAGMGLPNMKKNASEFKITSTEEGTTLVMRFFLDQQEEEE